MTDESLAIKAQENDYESEIELFARYKNVINKISRSFFLVGGDTEDLIQEGMIGLYRAIKFFAADKNASFSTFAYICIKRQIQSAIKRATADKNKPLTNAVSIAEVSFDGDDEDGSAGFVLPSLEPNPEAQLISLENMEEIKKSIKQALSDKEFSILKKYLAGQNYLEIANALDINKKSVDNALSRIKTKLSFLKKDGFKE